MNTQMLRQLIYTALNDKDNNVRTQAEAKIVQVKHNNPTSFFSNCSLLLKNENEQEFFRQSAGTLMSRLLVGKNPNSGYLYWDEINQETKVQIKNNILSVLISPNNNIMRAGANVIATIAAIEIPRGQWLQIIDTLIQNTANQDMNIKMASITTLGYVCEHIKTFRQQLSNSIRQNILSTIIRATADNDKSIVLQALNALTNSLPFMQEQMQNPQMRNHVFNVFIKGFQNNIHPNETYFALFEFVKVANRFMFDYKKELIDLTEAHLDLRDQISILNLEMWQMIGTQYSDKVQKNKERIGQFNQGDNFMQAVSTTVLPMIMKCLLVLNKHEEENEDLRDSAIKAISIFGQTCDQQVIDLITSSVATVLNSEEPGHKQATVLLFSAICDYPDVDYIIQAFENGFDHILSLLNYNNILVVRNSLLGFLRLSEALPEVFLSRKNVADVLDIFYNFLIVDNTKIQEIAATILNNITQGLKQVPKPVAQDPNILLTKMVKFQTQNLVKFHTNSHPQLNEKVVSIIMNIIIHTTDKKVLVDLISFTIDQYHQLVNQNIQNLENLLNNVLSILHVAILSHKNSAPNEQILSRICKLIDTHVRKFGVEDQGLSLIGATATTFMKKFQTKSQHFQNYIQHGLESRNDIVTFKAALACLGDFARMKESSFFNKAEVYLTKLLGYIKSDLDRELKISILTTIGDLMLILQSYGKKFVPQILQICNLCFQAVYEISQNPEDQEYVEDLKMTLIQMYSCCVFALNSQRECNFELFQHFSKLATFVVRTCAQSLHPTVEYLRTCLYLIYDAASFYWAVPQYQSQVRAILNSKEIEDLVQMIGRFSDKPEIKDLLDFIYTRKKI